MPRKAYNEKLSNPDIIRMIKEGKYKVEPDTGKIFGRDGNLFTFEGNDEGHLFVRLYNSPKHRFLPVSHVIWMAATGVPIPETGQWEIHHIDRDVKNNVFSNLMCLLRVDHEKLHYVEDSPSEEEGPF